MAKAALWATTDAKTRKHGERTGLETPVVHAVNDVHSVFGGASLSECQSQRAKCTAWEYGRKAKTQRN